MLAAIATRDGLVLAADSRLTVESVFCDGVDKFVEPRRPDRTILFLAGRRGFWPRAISSAPDVCAYIRRNVRELDLAEIAREFLETANVAVGHLDLLAVGSSCTTALSRHLRRNPDLVLEPTERLTEIVFAAYDPNARRSVIRSIALGLDSRDRVGCRARLERSFGLDDEAAPVLAGESGYFHKEVLPTFLDGPVQGATRRFWASHPKFPKVRDVSRQTAVDVATDIIRATSRMTLRVPASSGIGGPVVVRFIG